MSTLTRPEKLQRVVEMMAESFVHIDLVIDHTGKPRLLPTFVDELSNHYGLYIERHLRFFLNVETDVGKWNMAYHLPVQKNPGSFTHAASLLPDFYAPAAAALRRLERSHPRASGDRPPIPGLDKDPRDTGEVDERKVGETALQMLSEPGVWMTVSQFHELTGSARLSMFVGKFRERGINVVTKMLRSSIPGERPYATYHIFTDPAEEAAYMAEAAEEKRIRQKARDEAAAAAEARKNETADAKAAREAAKVEREAAKIARQAAKARGHHQAPPSSVAAGASRYGGWRGATAVPAGGSEPRKLFAAPAARPAPSAPSDATRQRILAQAAAGGASDPKPRGSAAGVPAAELDRLHPRADRTTVVEFQGATYQKAFRPLKMSPDGKRVMTWDPFWKVVSPGSSGQGAGQPG